MDIQFKCTTKKITVYIQMCIFFFCVLQYWIFPVNIYQLYKKKCETKIALYITNISKVDCHCKKTSKYFY